MRDDGDAAGLVDEGDGALERLERRDRAVDPQREEVAVDGGHLDARDQLEAPAVTRALVDLARREGATHVVVVGDGDDVEERFALDPVEDRDRVVHAVAVRGVDLEVGATEQR